MSVVQVRFGGLGGQGIVTAATVLGEAATIAGLAAAGSSSYGSAARGTACRSDVVVAEEAIDYPHLARPDVLAVMSQAAYDRFAPAVPEEGTVLYDDFAVAPAASGRASHRAVPATATAVREFGGRQGANIVMLGALVALTRIVPIDAVREAIRRGGRERFVAANLRALDLGFEWAGAAAGTSEGTGG